MNSGRWIRVIGVGLGLTGCAAAAAIALQTAFNRDPRQATPDSRFPIPDSRLPISDAPIRAEAEVFRTSASVVAVPPGAERSRDAHPRTMARYRFLRAYPGAPPRIPHGFTADEFRTGACNTCHRRGGYSPRFNAYVPVTPHPDMPACLQCHVGRDEVTGVNLPDLDPGTVCRQCHLPGAAAWSVEGLVNWRPMEWPRVEAAGNPADPPAVPHGLFFRENCLACHSGPSAVREIRTGHPERAACRSCHVVPDPMVGDFVRPIGIPR
jgi:cytochrome c-type protein NapB